MTPEISHMASFLTINDDCLCRIISFLDDPVSFHSVALSCKRIQQVINNTRSILHPKLLRLKAEYYIKCCLVEISDCSRDNNKFRNLENLLSNATRLAAAKELLTHAKAVNAWARIGPAAAKLFTWIRNQESRKEEGVQLATCFTESRSVTLHLPGCDKDLKIDTTYLHTQIDDDNDNKLSIHATCGDLDVTSEGVSHYCPCDIDSWEENECQAIVKPMKPVVELLQKELGATVPQMTNKFFLWLCYFFPHQNTLASEHKLIFENPSRNVKPTPEDVQPAIDLFHQNLQFDTSLRNLVSEWNDPDSNLPSLITKTMAVLIQRSETKFLGKLQRDAKGLYEIASDLRQTPLPKPFVQDLLLRTELQSRDHKSSLVADESESWFLDSRASFRFSGGRVVKVCGGIHGDEESYPTWYKLELTVTLPNREELQLDSDHRYRRIPIQVERLSPVTELFQQGVNKCMEGEEHIPMLDDHFTAYYLLHALKFGEQEETFLREDEENGEEEHSEEEHSEEEHNEEEHREEEHNEEEHSEEEHNVEEHNVEEHNEEEHSEEEHNKEEHREEEHNEEEHREEDHSEEEHSKEEQ